MTPHHPQPLSLLAELPLIIGMAVGSGPAAGEPVELERRDAHITLLGAPELM